MKKSVVAIFGIAGVFTLSSWAGTGAGYRENTDIFVPEGPVSNVTETMLVSEGTLNKFGEGGLTLSVSNLFSAGKGTLAVRGGSVRLTDFDATVAPAMRPDAVLRDAAFWVDANTNLVTESTGGVTYVSAWLDSRETSSSGPYVYPRAVSSQSFTNCYPELVSQSNGGNEIPAVFFGKDTSGRWMQWTKPDGSVADINGIQHIFFVRGIFYSCGFVIGSQVYTSPDFHAGNYGNQWVGGSYWAGNSHETIPLYRGRTYLNGTRIDGSRTNVKEGFQLQEVALAENTAHGANFFNDRNISPRQGGDYLCEVIIFTNRLSEVNRIAVERYLMQKWHVTPATGVVEVKTAPETSVQAELADGTWTNTAFFFSGHGVFEKCGTGSLVLPDLLETPVFHGETVLSEGELDARIPMPLQVRPGRRVNAAGTVLTADDDAPVGSFVKEGRGKVTASSIPASVNNLQVKDGVLVLKAPERVETATAEIYGTIPDPSFEEEPLSNTTFQMKNGVSHKGWTCVDPEWKPNDSYCLIYNRRNSIVNNSWTWCCPYPPQDGEQCLVIKWDASVYTTLTVPVAGVYDITYDTSGRSGDPPLLLDFCIVDGDKTNAFATVCAFSTPWYKQRIRTPWLTAGEHTLLLRNFCQHLDATGAFDNFRVTLVSTEKSDGTIPVPNGDFELTNHSCGANRTRWPLFFVTNNVALGWTCSGNVLDSSGCPLSAPTRFGGDVATYADNVNTAFWRRSPSYGNVAMALQGGDNAYASTQMTLPAGTYRLRGDVVNWHYRSGLSRGAELEAVITHADGTEDSIGSVSYIGADMASMVWPESFTMAENETVTLTLRLGNVNDSMLVDNLVVIPGKGRGELISNGGFEKDVGWSFFHGRDDVPSNKGATIAYNDNMNDGNLTFEGKRRLRLCNIGGAAQQIVVPEDGMYRLVFHACIRNDLMYKGDSGKNPIRAWLAQGGVTNLIGWTRVDSIPFVKHEFLFRATAGTYTLGLQGMTDNSAEFPGTDRTSLLDGVSVMRVPEFTQEEFELPAGLTVSLDAGARLQLDFVGTNRVTDLYFNGRRVSGVVDQTGYPSFVTGPGALYTPAKGTFIFVR